MRRIIRKVKTILIIFKNSIYRVLRFAGEVLPRKKSLVIFGSRNGDYYMDNSRDLYEWVTANRPEIHAVWLTKNKEVLKELKLQNKSAESLKSLKGIYLLLRSQVAIYSNRLLDISPHWSLIPNSTKCICLGHGAPIKNYRCTIKGGVQGDFAKDINRASKLCKYAVASSDFIAKLDSKCQNINYKKYRVTGYPRNDKILNPTNNMKTSWHEYLGGYRYNRVILYAPTWRKEGDKQTKFFPFDDFEIDSLVKYLRENKILLLMRPHIKDLEDNVSFEVFKERTSNLSSNIRLATSKEFTDVNDILPFIDILITDYSSIMTDFLLLDRPILFFAYDYVEFEELNGFVYDYYEHLPGPDIKTFYEFCKYINMLTESIDDHKAKRQTLAKKAHKYFDSKASERVSQLIEMIIAE